MEGIPNLIALTVALAVAGCATPPTPYQAAGKGRHGYLEHQIDEDTWRVRFSGNLETDRAVVEDYALYRAAEITLEQGADGFVVVREDVEKDITYYGNVYYPSHGIFYGHRRRYPWARYGYGFGYGPSTLRSANSYTDHLKIVMFRDQAPAGLGPVHDAQEILRVMGRKIVRPAPIGG